MEQRTLRRFQADDTAQVCQLYAATTRLINGTDYTPEQIERWAHFADDVDGWCERLLRHRTNVIASAGRILGFAELEGDGEVGYFYVDAHHQGRGIGSSLMLALVADAQAQSSLQLRAAVSISALPFFQRHGFTTTAVNRPLVCGVEAVQYRLARSLTDRLSPP